MGAEYRRVVVDRLTGQRHTRFPTEPGRRYIVLFARFRLGAVVAADPRTLH